MIDASSIVVAHRITRQYASDVDAYVRAILTFDDGSRLESMQYVWTTPRGSIEVNRYSFHWMNADNSLRMRWDNAEHHLGLANFPHHRHDGDEKNVLPSEPMNLSEVLDVIASELKKTTRGRQ
jgi:hypothetical protein